METIDWSKLTPEERVEQYAIENYKRGLNCAECVLSALQREGALDILKEAVGMGVGFAPSNCFIVLPSYGSAKASSCGICKYR